MFQTWFVRSRSGRILLAFGALTFAASFARSEQADNIAILRWGEGQPGCTFSGDDDGKYRYGLWTDEFGIVLAVDALELQKTRRRIEPIFTGHLTIRDRGKDSIAVEPDKITLEFLDHSRTVQSALQPADLSEEFREKATRFAAESKRTVEKHPETAAATRSEVANYQKTVADMLEFLQRDTLRAITLDGEHRDASGWVLFTARSKWIGDWKKQERFELRVPMAGRLVVFPFALPPSQGDVLLRRRP